MSDHIQDTSTSKRFCIVLASYNGARFLDEQMQSIADQSIGVIDVVVSDDGSTDDTLAKLEDWQKRWSRGTITIQKGPKQGFAENFRSLLINVPDGYDYYGFCDQDDIWLPQKLEAAQEKLKGRSDDAVALYCGRTRSIDEEGNKYGLSPLMERKPSFANALVQSIAGCNTMIFTAGLKNLLRISAERTSFVSHDWWAYLICTGAGGTVIYEPEPYVLYRQHGGNLVGANSSIHGRLSRLKQGWVISPT